MTHLQYKIDALGQEWAINSAGGHFEKTPFTEGHSNGASIGSS